MKNISKLDLFRAFRSLNYTLYFWGRAVSQFGTWMQRTAVIWVVYSISHSPLVIGMTILAEQFPSFVFSIPGGVVADRYNRYKIIKLMQILSMVQSVLLALLVMSSHTPPIWAILVLSVMLGIINAFDVPARQSLIHVVVADEADLPNALSLTASTASLAQLLGPAAAGLVLSAFGASVCFFINAASFAGVLISLILMKLPAYIPKNTKKKVLADFAEGFSYITKAPGIGYMILMLAFVSLLVLPYNTVLPVFAKVIFKGNASTYGYITSFVGVGATLGTMFIASRKPGAHLKRILLISTIMMGAGLICFSLIKSFPIAMFFAAVTGFGSLAQFTICNVVVQSESAPEMRGRAIGILLMSIFGMLPLGSVLVGAVSERVGAPATMLGQGIIALVIAAVSAKFLLRSKGKPAEKDSGIAETEEVIVDDEV
jgi:MFS family permease